MRCDAGSPPRCPGGCRASLPGGSWLPVPSRPCPPSRPPGGRWAPCPEGWALTPTPWAAGRAPGRAAGSGHRLRRRVPRLLGLRPQAGGEDGHGRGGGRRRAAGLAPSLRVSAAPGGREPRRSWGPRGARLCRCPPGSRYCVRSLRPSLHPSPYPSLRPSLPPSAHLELGAGVGLVASLLCA